MIFAFRCQKCGAIIETSQPLGQSPVVPEHCDTAALRQFVPLGVIYRCSGFQHTDSILDKPTEDQLLN